MNKTDQIRSILASSFYIPSLDTEGVYQILEDDSPDGTLSVCISNDGDVHVQVMPGETKHAYSSIRFRTFAGGGRHKRVRNAILILAEAIRLDLNDPLL